MNPVPGMSARTRVSISPASRTQTRSSSTTSCSGSENEQSKSELVAEILTVHAHEDKNDVRDKDISAYANDSSQNYENKAIPGSNEEGINPDTVCLVSQKDTSDCFQRIIDYTE
ncbi:hypothetical protein HAX54_028702 [Datura stramonium]|uniref:Uncharacterized protein n=1 Tax=Datura stramonium TaxID=4076 RepID=A0ABS8S9P6_DATST|nr:hypothetical protein [Datura stramonium]